MDEEETKKELHLKQYSRLVNKRKKQLKLAHCTVDFYYFTYIATRAYPNKKKIIVLKLIAIYVVFIASYSCSTRIFFWGGIRYNIPFLLALGMQIRNFRVGGGSQKDHAVG